jgi:hypothetical protein
MTLLEGRWCTRSMNLDSALAAHQDLEWMEQQSIRTSAQQE